MRGELTGNISTADSRQTGIYLYVVPGFVTRRWQWLNFSRRPTAAVHSGAHVIRLLFHAVNQLSVMMMMMMALEQWHYSLLIVMIEAMGDIVYLRSQFIPEPGAHALSANLEPNQEL